MGWACNKKQANLLFLLSWQIHQLTGSMKGITEVCIFQQQLCIVLFSFVCFGILQFFLVPQFNRWAAKQLNVQNIASMLSHFFFLLPANCSSCLLLKWFNRGGSYSFSGKSNLLQRCHVKHFLLLRLKSKRGKKTQIAHRFLSATWFEKTKNLPWTFWTCAWSERLHFFTTAKLKKPYKL